MSEEASGGLRDGVGADEAAKAEKKERTPTKYHVLIWNADDETFVPVLDDNHQEGERPEFKVIEAFRRDQVIDDLRESALIELEDDALEDGVAVTPYLLIVPASSSGVVRGRERVKRTFGIEE